MALLTTVALDLGHGHATDADRGERLADFVKLEGFDNGDNELHVQAFVSRSEISHALDLRPAQVCHLSAPMAQKVAGPTEK
jgi:hypothetical protein